MTILYNARTKELTQRFVTTGRWHPSWAYSVLRLVTFFTHIYIECMSYMLCMNICTHRTCFSHYFNNFSLLDGGSETNNFEKLKMND